MRIDPHGKFPVRECPGCGMEVPANENRCPICQYEFPVRGTLHRHLWWIALVLLALLLLPLLRALR